MKKVLDFAGIVTMLLVVIIPLLLIESCSKEGIEQPEKCTPVAIYSDRYTLDTTYISSDRLDTNCLSGHWLEVYKGQQDKWFLHCDQFGNGLWLERLRHLIY